MSPSLPSPSSSSSLHIATTTHHVTLIACIVIIATLATLPVAECRYRRISARVRMRQVSTSVNHIWALSTSNRIYRCARPCNGKWLQVPGILQQLDVGDEEVWGVGRRGHIWKRAADGSGGWVYIPGRLKHVSASGSGYIWGVSLSNRPYKCKKPCTGAWSCAGGSLMQVNAGSDYVYGLYRYNVYSRPVDGSQNWRYIPGKKIRQITGSGHSDVFGIGCDGILYRCKKPCIGEWEQMIGRFAQCDATFDSLIAVTGSGYVYERKTGI